MVYATTTEQLADIRDAIEQYVDGSGDFVSPDQTSRYVRIDSFNESAISILVYRLTRSAIYRDCLEAREKPAIELEPIGK